MFALVTQEYLQGVGRESAVMKGIVFLLAIVVLVVTFIGGKSTFQYRRMGHWSLELDVAPCRLGGQLSGNLVTRSGVRVPREIRAHLSCQFVGDESVESRAIWTSAPLLVRNESQRDAANGNTSFRLLFAVPRDQPPTDRVAIAGGILGGKPGMRWVVMVSSDDVPALRDSFIVPVFALPDNPGQPDRGDRG